ncbi:aminodeoxychorismate synthase, component I [Robertmurraya siralis]|uniref:Aminodeoxychorismate synthase, component I n=1 Tax=Robertmurraya siralis TaxID=77777 RepID=A0A920BTL8_9BACI|nr:aminodeoxychorismate synthase component I [Robertmurraya siralis]GIN61761.1 aminodeoxychorismate synthase, component I [Robertmurraya siralis]
MNDKNRKSPLLSFEFATAKGQITPHTFSDPEKIIMAQTIEEVIPSLQKIEEAVEEGYYAAGFLTYESAPAFDPAFKVREGSKMPLLWFGLFADVDHLPLNSCGSYQTTSWQPSVQRDEYDAAIEMIKKHIEYGDTYQTNFTLRLHSEFEGDDLAFFEHLKKAQSSNYCAYLNIGEHRILSASPELFFHLNGNEMTTRPMKGTIKRGRTYVEDINYKKSLQSSEKDRAENVMIVDLLRNDLGMISEPGTVKVEQLFNIEPYPTVFQMTSTITSMIPEHTSITDVFKALFPCGSITGAPKIKTMEIISELEREPREVYCGAIGYITPDKEAIFNVPIRTILIEEKTKRATYGVGGGITWDSTTTGEYDEVVAKASILQEIRTEFQLLETILLEDGEFFLLAEHLQRLRHSASYFGYAFSDENLQKRLLKLATSKNAGQWRVRLLLSENGEVTIESHPFSTTVQTAHQVILADEPVNSASLFLFHKTTNRALYRHFQNKFPHVFDVLLWNESGEITEFTNGNIVVELEDKLWTPPVGCGLLAGTFRKQLLTNGIIEERILTRDDLKFARKIWFINSIRKWVEVEFV